MGGDSDLFLELFSDLPRLGPGGDEQTVRALSFVEGLPERPLILDLGCGVGRSALVLAEHTGGRVVGVDNSPAYLDVLAGAARERGLEGRVETRCGDMAQPPVEPGSADLIWAEGSIYILGFERGLRLWRPLLRPGGWIAATEISWLAPDPPPRALSFWRDAYPTMQDLDGNLAALRRAGFQPEAHFALPAESWEEEYYRPLERRLAGFEAAHRDEPAAASLAAQVREEIAVFRDSGGSYSYVFYIARRTD